MDHIRHEALGGIVQLERELIVRDFVSVLNDGALEELLPFLTEHVTFTPSPTRSVTGRADVVRMISGIRSTFAEWVTTLVTVAVVGDTVLTHQELRVRLPDASPVPVLGFASFRLEGARISDWHQLHG